MFFLIHVSTFLSELQVCRKQGFMNIYRQNFPLLIEIAFLHIFEVFSCSKIIFDIQVDNGEFRNEVWKKASINVVSNSFQTIVAQLRQVLIVIHKSEVNIGYINISFEMLDQRALEDFNNMYP